MKPCRVTISKRPWLSARTFDINLASWVLVPLPVRPADDIFRSSRHKTATPSAFRKRFASESAPVAIAA